MGQHVDHTALTEGSCQLHCKQLSQGRAAKFAHARCLPEVRRREYSRCCSYFYYRATDCIKMGKHKFTDEIAQGRRQKAKNFHEKITACIERATVLRAKYKATPN